MTCHALRQCDEMFCAVCNLRWDVNEGDAMCAPPTGRSALSEQVAGSHYKGLRIQPVEFAMRNRWDFSAGSALKYLSRWRVKNGKQDLEKAHHFIRLRREFDDFSYPHFRATFTMRQYVVANGISASDARPLYALDDLVLHGGADRYAFALLLIEHLPPLAVSTSG